MEIIARRIEDREKIVGKMIIDWFHVPEDSVEMFLFSDGSKLEIYSDGMDSTILDYTEKK